MLLAVEARVTAAIAMVQCLVE